MKLIVVFSWIHCPPEWIENIRFQAGLGKSNNAIFFGQSSVLFYFRSVNHEVVGRCPAPAWNSGQGRGWGWGRRRSPVWGWHHLQGSHRVMLWMTTKQGLWSLKYVKDWLLTVYFAAPWGEELHLRGLWVEVWSNCVQEDPWKSPGVDLLHPGWQGGREVEHWEVQQVAEYFCVNVIYIYILKLTYSQLTAGCGS